MAKKSSFSIVGLLVILVGLVMAFFGYKSISGKADSQEVATAETQPAQETAAPEESAPTTQVEQVEEVQVPEGEFLAAHGNPAITDHLVPLPAQFTTKDELVHADVYQPLLAMIDAAAQDGVNLTVVSAYRSHARQKQIWEKKWGDAPQDSVEKALEILQWSSFPGTSRHHWGTDVDFNNVNTAYWQAGEGAATYQWLQANAAKFGFCQTYGPNRDKGYNEEPWHWSHMPTAKQYFAQASHPNSLTTIVNQGVKGSAAVQQLPLIDYITGITPCSVE